ncbi:glycosyltransferase family 4 protein [Gramella sp. MAR_2010_147]|uniref:glycosyltransferase family 4 protein n=1 Tax=Gramella sp. MAR_2010_147 TaxID=1250205 RepID=UPI00087AE700|nr:glycosyltransferase family 4 protein [Gramella sp. MAR_2010_147]SDR69927.1 Glycosyltransferase involved in cell wall bisynthesis [Gramella sp. MAR_2010_147]
MSKLKILQIIQKPQLRGAEIFACQLSNHLLEQEHEVMVVSVFPGDAELPFQGKVVKLDRPQNKRFFDPNGWKEFSKLVKDFNADIIQANAGDTLKFMVSSKMFYPFEAKIIFRNANKMGDFIDSKFKYYLNKAYVSRLDYVISVSKECQIDFQQTFNFPDEKISTVEIGVEHQYIDEDVHDLNFLEGNHKVITHIGGYVPEKNHLRLIHIFKQITYDYPNAKLLLIGKGHLEEKVRKEVKSLNLDKNIHFLGYRNDVLEILSHSDAFVLPSLIEGLPGVILEAMYCKTPVVAYNVGGVKEVVKHDTGWLVEKNDEETFINSLREVLNSDSQSASKIQNANKMIHDRFLNKIISKRFLSIYDEVKN